MEFPLKAHIIIGSLPLISHLTPMRTIAQNLVSLCYPVTFITNGEFQQSIEDIGATCFVPSAWKDFRESSLTTILQNATTSTGVSSTGVVPECIVKAIMWMLGTMLQQFNAVQGVLASGKAQDPSRPVVFMSGSSFFGSRPFLLGTPGLWAKGVIAIGYGASLVWSGLLPDASVEGRMRNEQLNKAYLGGWAPLQAELNKILRGLGAKETELNCQNVVLSLSTFYLQTCPKSLEFPRSDAPTTLRFPGGLPRNDARTYDSSVLPEWWGEVVHHGKNQIDTVTQGTIMLKPEDLIIPALKALKDSEDILAVVALGKWGATLPADYLVPGKARVADCIPFDALLPLSDVILSNGGYGSFQNALVCGALSIVAPPFFADKRDIGARVEWSGTGTNLRTGTPTSEQLKEAVHEILSDGNYKKRVLEIKAEIATYDPMAIITGAINEVASS